MYIFFNNAGIGGDAGFVAGLRQERERTFDICWGGVYRTTRVILASLVCALRHASSTSVQSTVLGHAWIRHATYFLQHGELTVRGSRRLL